MFGVRAGAADVAARRCQRRIRKATQRFVRQRAKELVLLGRRRATRAPDYVETIAAGCADLSGAPLPVGGVCAELPDPSDARAVAFCLRGILEEVVQETTGVSVVPNVLFVLTDDQRWDTMDVLPLTRERLTERGLEFTESFTVTSLCCPDRATILTGLCAHEHGVKTNRGAMDFDHDGDTIARQLQENAGYKTALVGNCLVFTWRALGRRVPPGWDEWHALRRMAPPTTTTD